MSKETRREHTARVFPLATRIIQGIHESGGSQPEHGHIKALRDAYKDDENEGEAQAAAQLVLTTKWPAVVSSRGRAKLKNYLQPDLWPDHIRKAACWAYSIKLQDGSEEHRCLYQMNADQRKQVVTKIKGQIGDLRETLTQIGKLEKHFTKIGIPDNQAPSEFLTLRPDEPKAEAKTPRKARVLEPA